MNLENESPEFHVGDYVLLSTEDIDIAKGLHGSSSGKGKHVGPFRILEERVAAKQSKSYRVEAPKCLGFSNYYFDKLVMFQQCQDTPKRFLADKDAETRREKVGRLGDHEHVGKKQHLKGHQADMVAEQECEGVDGRNTGQKMYLQNKEGNKGKEGPNTQENTQVKRICTNRCSPDEHERTREQVTVKIETPVDTSKATSVGPRRSPPRTRRRQINKQDDDQVNDQVNDAEEAPGPSPSDVKADTLRLINSIRKTKLALEASSAEGTTVPAGEKPEVHIIDGEVEYEVEKILDDRKVDTDFGHQRMEYLVKWKGYPESEATWEPRSNLTHVSRILKEYTKNRRRRRNGRR